MPRKSKLELSVVSPIGEVKLPVAPADLTELQQIIWMAVVNDKGADWWDVATLPLLRSYVVHESQAQVVDKLINDIDPIYLTTEDGLDRYKDLAKIRALHTGKIESLATKMRLTHQSRYGARQADTASRKSSSKSGTKPWEFKG